VENGMHDEKIGRDASRKEKKRKLNMEEWYLANLLSLWSFELPHIAPLCLLFANVVGGDVIIL
jgi:hypothetical protein